MKHEVTTGMLTLLLIGISTLAVNGPSAVEISCILAVQAFDKIWRMTVGVG